MNKLFNLVLAVFILIPATFIAPGAVHADSNTSSDNQPGQVKVNSQDGTLYLTTSVNPNPAATTSAQPHNIIHNNGASNTSPSHHKPVGSITQPLGFAPDLGTYINAILNMVIVISLLLVFLYFIFAGFQWITSGGDRGKTEEARNKIIHAGIGILIVSASFALVTFVAYILGFSSVNDAISHIQPITPA